jgi:hypothetical protein
VVPAPAAAEEFEVDGDGVGTIGVALVSEVVALVGGAGGGVIDCPKEWFKVARDGGDGRLTAREGGVLRVVESDLGEFDDG